jgi:phage baseplate assembly protein W
MSTYNGFSTIDANKPKTTTTQPGVDGGVGGITQPIILGKKFRLVDAPLVIRDFVNALNIPKGQKVGQPEYGTTIWSYIFEPNNADTQFALEDEIRRIANNDPRLILNTVKSYVQDNGILLEVELAVAPFNSAITLNLFFDSQINQATIRA